MLSLTREKNTLRPSHPFRVVEPRAIIRHGSAPPPRNRGLRSYGSRLFSADRENRLIRIRTNELCVTEHVARRYRPTTRRSFRTTQNVHTPVTSVELLVECFFFSRIINPIFDSRRTQVTRPRHKAQGPPPPRVFSGTARGGVLLKKRRSTRLFLSLFHSVYETLFDK